MEDKQLTLNDGFDQLAGGDTRVSGKGFLSIGGEFTQEGAGLTVLDGGTMLVMGETLIAGGRLLLKNDGKNDGWLIAVGGVTVASGGEISGTGVIWGDVTNWGRIVVGGERSFGTLMIIGDFTQAGNLVFSIGFQLGRANQVTDSSQLFVLGDVQLGGTLTAQQVGFGVLKKGNTFSLLIGIAKIQGAFANQQLPDLGGGLQWTVNIGTDVQLVI